MKEGKKKRNNKKKIKNSHKDSAFKLLFHEKEKAIELYNALAGTDYGPGTDIEIRTLNNVLFMDIENDLAFTIENKSIVVCEHQSTWCPNMPLRMAVYIGRIFERLFDGGNIYGKKRMQIPVPEFYVLYNGMMDFPEEVTLRLSDLFLTEAPENSIELVVKMININYNKGAELLNKCKTMQEYSRLVYLIREEQGKGLTLEAAVEAAILKCKEEGVLTDFLQKYGVEVLGMLFREVTQEEYGDIREAEGREQGLEQGKRKALVDLVREGLLGVPIAAQKAGLTEKEFEDLLKE